MPRRLSLILLLGVLSILILGSLFFSEPIRSYIPKTGPETAPPGSLQEPPSHSKVDTTTTIPTPESQGSIHVALTETGGSHDEVVAAFVHSFAAQPRVKMDIYQLLPRYGIKDIIAAFDTPNKLNGPRSPTKFLDANQPDQVSPDIWIATTCEIDLPKYEKHLAGLLAGKTYIFCVVHHADRWNNDRMKKLAAPWIEKSRLEFVTLSPHTAEFLQKEGVSKWNTQVPPLIRYLVPVFPVKIAAEQPTTTAEGGNAPFPTATGSDELGFALQGDYDPSRRDYASLFSRLESFLSGALKEDNKNLIMHLLGHGENKPTVPESIKSNVQFNERLSYIEYYSVIANTFALLPAFANNEYLDRKASSTVPASLIAGVPLVATKEMVDAYAYLNLDIVWLQKEGTSDMDVVAEVLRMSREERRSKKQAVRERREEIINGNVKRVGEWIAEAFNRMGKEV